MVAPNKNQSVQLSPSFSVKDVLEQHTKENVKVPLLEMEAEPATERRPEGINEYLGIPSSSSPTSTKSAKKNKKSVRFSNDVRVHEIPTLTQNEKANMFFNKLDKQNSKLQIKRLVTYYRVEHGNNFFFSTVSPSEEKMIIQIPEEEKTKIGLEAQLNPQMKMAIRRRMTKLVLQHQNWSRQHPSFFDDQFLAQNCTTVAKSATLLALERAQNVVKELASDKLHEGPLKNIRVNMSNSTSTCKVDTSATTIKESRMEAPGQSCMVR